MKKLSLVLSLLFVIGCDGSTEPSGPGTITVSIVSPNGAEGAAILDIVGPVETVTGANDVSAYPTPSATGTRVVLVRMTPGSLQVRLGIPDVSRPPSVSVIEVADGNDRLRESVGGYSVELD